MNEDENNTILQIGKLLREYRLNSYLTQTELSELSGIHRNTIARIENCKNISVYSLSKIIESLGITLSDLDLTLDPE